MKRLVITALAVALALAGGAAPKKAAAKPVRKPAAAMPAETEHRRLPYVGAISADVKTRAVLFSDRANAEAYPASVTKLMTLLLVIEDVRTGKYSFDTVVEATKDVDRSEASWIGLKAGDRMSVRDLCTALMVESANDAAIALAVNSAGSFDGFIERMNGRARGLGMTKTTYYNPNGLPPNPSKRYPWKHFNVTTAADQLKLALQILEYPETLQFTSVKTADLVRTRDGYRVPAVRRTGAPEAKVTLGAGETLVKHLANHNNVMTKDKQKIVNPDGSEAVDGLKTGYIDAGGSSVVITGTRDGRRAVAVVLGSLNSKERDAAAKRLLEDALEVVSWK